MTDSVSKDAKKTDQERAEEVDAEILAAIASRKKLASDMELAKGINYTESIKTTYVTAAIPMAVLIYLSPGGDHLDISARGLRNSTANSKINFTSSSTETTSPRRYLLLPT